MCRETFPSVTMLREHRADNGHYGIGGDLAQRVLTETPTNTALGDDVPTRSISGDRSSLSDDGGDVASSLDHSTNMDADALHCAKCDKSFARNSSYLAHIRRFHNDDLHISCPACALRFLTDAQLSTHVLMRCSKSARTTNGAPSDDADVDQLSYTASGDESSGNEWAMDTDSSAPQPKARMEQILMRHKRRHTTLPAWCDVCNHTYSRRSKLFEHIRRQHNDRPVAVSPPIKAHRTANESAVKDTFVKCDQYNESFTKEYARVPIWIIYELVRFVYN